MKNQIQFAERSRNLKPSPIRKLVPMMKEEGMISFGGGYPNEKTFAFNSLEVNFKTNETFKISESMIESAFQYGPTDCHPELREHLINWHKHKDDVLLSSDQLQVLNGSQEGLHIMGYLFLNPGDCVALSEPAYPGALGAFRAFTDEFITFPVDSNGSDTNVLSEILQHRQKNGKPMPKFIYEVPNGHNPAGVTLSLERRMHLLEMAERYGILVLEDDPYQLVQLDKGQRLPSIQSLDKKGQVIRLDSFSKIFAPGLRLGYASGPAEVINKFQLYKQVTNLHTSSLVQIILAGYLASHGADGLIEMINKNCNLYRENRDCMIDSLENCLADKVKFDCPTSGMFLWLRLANSINAEELINKYSLEKKVLMVPGSAFSTGNGLKNCVRLSFSKVSKAQIKEGISRMAEMIG